MKPLLAYCTTFKPNVTCYNNNASLLIETLCGTAVIVTREEVRENMRERETPQKRSLSLILWYNTDSPYTTVSTLAASEKGFSLLVH